MTTPINEAPLFGPTVAPVLCNTHRIPDLPDACGSLSPSNVETTWRAARSAVGSRRCERPDRRVATRVDRVRGAIGVSETANNRAIPRDRCSAAVAPHVVHRRAVARRDRIARSTALDARRTTRPGRWTDGRRAHVGQCSPRIWTGIQYRRRMIARERSLRASSPRPARQPGAKRHESPVRSGLIDGTRKHGSCNCGLRCMRATL